MGHEPGGFRPYRTWILLMAVALAARSAALWRSGALLVEDRDGYGALAREVASGRGFVDPASGLPTAYRPPLYPLILALIDRAGAGPWAIGALQALLGLATVALCVVAAAWLGLGPGRWVVGLLVALDPLLLHNTALVMTEVFAALLAALLLTLHAMPPRRGKALALGAAWGCACLCRPTFLAAAALTAAGFLPGFCKARDCWPNAAGGNAARGKAAMRNALAGALACGAAFLLITGAWAARNRVRMGEWVLSTTHGGYTLLLAHNPVYAHEVIARPWAPVWGGQSVRDWARAAELDVQRDLAGRNIRPATPAYEIERDRLFNRRAWDFMRQRPELVPLTAVSLWSRMWAVVPSAAPGQLLPWYARWGMAAYYGATLVALVVGVARCRRCLAGSWWPALALIAAFTAVHALYWADMRMRAPLVPAIALWAAKGLSLRKPG